MLYNYYVSYTTDLININNKRKTLFFYIKYTNKIYELLTIFKKINLISGFVLIKKKIKNKKYLYFRVSSSFYKNFQIVSKINIVSKPSKKFFLSLKALKLLSLRSGKSIYLISTSRGIFTHHDALRKNISGFILGFFN
uniref:Ribosomal protein S8 n=1 Tax=Paraurostyla sp. TaxID=6014 RepID=A0A3Q8BFS9_9STIC|nr:ribosomal protein S8 [Paraurostyla sp.]